MWEEGSAFVLRKLQARSASNWLPIAASARNMLNGFGGVGVGSLIRKVGQVKDPATVDTVVFP